MKSIDGFRAKKKAKKQSPTKAFATVLSLAEFGGKSMEEERVSYPLNEDEKAAVEIVRQYVSALRRQVGDLVKMLREVQKKRFHEPDSDRREYCGGCGRSPHNEPPHTEDCLVPRIEALLRKVAKA